LAKNLELELKSLNYGYHFSILTGNDINKIWDIRKAGLALLSNVPGDAKPVSIVEDTAVIPALLPEYIKEFKNLVNKYNIPCVYYGHLGAGELHIKPVLNLKKKEDKELLRKIMLENVELVKKYRGSLSGEHGDGRLRSEFVRDFYGDNIYNKFCEIKNLWDPKGIFNPGKIISNIPANAYIRYKKVYKNYDIKTFFDFSSRGGILRAVEQCTGSADCRKTHITGGIMCPTYMATLDESCTTRARANILREFLTNSNKKNPFNYNEIHEIMKLCLACKGCKAECASDIDMARLKSEFLYQWNKTNGIPVKSKLISSVSKINKIGSYFPELYNYVLTNNLTSFIIKKGLGFSTKRKLPLLNDITFSKWYKRIGKHIISNDKPKRIVYFFIDEFSEYNDVKIAIKMLKLFNVLGYKVIIPGNYESGRAALSRGLLPKTRRVAEKNIKIFASLITQETPLIGIEPSAILSFRDEYPDLVKPALRDSAEKISKYTFMVDEFLSKEYKKGNIDRDLFTTNYKYIRLHGHCHQKAIVGIQPTIEILEIPINYKVKEIKSGCCGMAGDFGYEKNNYELSMKIGELVLFPEIREEPESTVIVAPGTSCRYQIMEGTGRKAYHPVEVLYDALITNSIKI